MNKKHSVAGGKLKEAMGILLVLACAGAVLCGILLISKCEREEAPHEAKVELNRVTDTETGIVYIECTEGIGPTTVKDVYMECEDEGKHLTFYEIAFESPDKFIALKNGEGYTVYRAENIDAPTINSFKPVGAKLFLPGSSYPIDNFYSAEVAAENSGTEDGSVYIELIENAIKSGKTAKATGAWGDKDNYEIWMYSETFVGLYYKVDFKIDVNGAEYLYDRVTGKLYSAPKELVARIVS